MATDGERPYLMQTPDGLVHEIAPAHDAYRCGDTIYSIDRPVDGDAATCRGCESDRGNAPLTE